MWGMKSTFWLQINTKIFSNLIVSLWMCVACHSESIINNKFAISLQYLKENAKDDIDFLSVDTFFRFLVSFYAWPGIPKLSKI